MPIHDFGYFQEKVQTAKWRRRTDKVWLKEMVQALKSDGRLPEHTKTPVLLKDRPKFVVSDKNLVLIDKSDLYVVFLVKIGGQYRAMTVIMLYYSSYEFHETCHAVTFIVLLVDSHQR